MTRALVSVVIPCFNAERWIGATLDAVLSQTWSHIETIVVDDGSTDGAVDLVRGYESRGVKLIVQQNRGAAAARNVGFAAARGAYVQFMDADDLISPDKVRSQVERLEPYADAVATCPWARFNINPGDAVFASFTRSHDLSPIDWLVEAWSDGGGMLFPAMWLVPRQVISRAGLWREDLSLNDDGEFFTRVVLASNRVLFCEGGSAYYRSGLQGSLSGMKSARAWQSGFEAIRSCIESARNVEDSERVRRCGSLLWQVYAHSCYPYEPRIANEALARARRLHRVEIRPSGGVAFKALSRVIGWRLARRLQVATGRP